MELNLRELIDLLVRWTHVIAGIMWIGNSMLFNWLDRNLEPLDWPREGVQGKIWLLHSGAFYEVEKKLLPRGARYPEKVHWFMFQNLTTWVSGIFLLAIVYYMGGAAFMIDPTVAQLSAPVAITVGVATLVGGWFVYDLLWRSPVGKSTPLAFAISFALLIGIAFGLAHWLSGRAAYIHIGALMGTLMTGNVWLYIVPSQRGLVAATKAGEPQDPALSNRAKQRSIHNNYMTFPVLFIMISNHYPITYGNQLNWLILAVLMVGSALIRHFMNIRFSYGPWLRWAAGAGIVAMAAVMMLTARPVRTPSAAAAEGPVSFAAVQAVISHRCVVCHSAHPTDDIFIIAPTGVMFDTPEQIAAMATRINERAFVSRTMPFNNKTGITDAERDMLGRWYAQGAKTAP
ncbi:MAG: urate hydroxylase PuuD [Chloroflexales bacterium]